MLFDLHFTSSIYQIYFKEYYIPLFIPYKPKIYILPFALFWSVCQWSHNLNYTYIINFSVQYFILNSYKKFLKFQAVLCAYRYISFLLLCNLLQVHIFIWYASCTYNTYGYGLTVVNFYSLVYLKNIFMIQEFRSRYLLDLCANLCLYNNMHINVYSSSIYNHQKLKTKVNG